MGQRKSNKPETNTEVVVIPVEAGFQTLRGTWILGQAWNEVKPFLYKNHANP